MKVYMEVTQDKYELPVAVADSVRELAYVVGVKENTVCNIMSRAKKEVGDVSILRLNWKKVELMTNADRIRNMSNDELAELLAKNTSCNNCCAKKECKSFFCKDEILKWLESEECHI